MIRSNRLIKLVRDLIKIDSQNPPGNEKAIADFCRRYLSGAGIKTRILAFEPGRDNVLAQMGAGSRSLLITPHLDTVPAGKGWTSAPLGARIRGDRLYGLGATDCKCNLACAMEALVSLAEDAVRLPYRLVFAATADEETGSARGLIPLLERNILRADAAVVLDADGFDIVVAQKGLMHVKLAVIGKRSHGAYPWLGRNAIDEGMSVVAALKKELAGKGRHPYLHPSTVNVGTIRGGDKVNIVADWCDIEVDVRFLPGTHGADLVQRVRHLIARTGRGHVSIKTSSVQEPYAIDVSHPVVTGLRTAMRRAGREGRVAGSEGATVITFFQHKGIPAVATGFGARGKAHMTDEFARVSDIVSGARVLDDFLRNHTFGG